MGSPHHQGRIADAGQAGHEQEAAVETPSDAASALLAGATTTWDRAVAVNNWLNAHAVPDRSDLEEIRLRLRVLAKVPPPELLHIPLPAPPRSPDMALVDALHARRSVSAYSDRPLPSGALGSVLRHAVGFGRTVAAYGNSNYPLSVAPSGGGLNSVTVHVAVRNVEDVPAGTYRYDFISHSLVILVPGDPLGALLDIYLQEEFASAPVSLLLVGRLGRVLAKYPLRHYRVLHVDAGIAVQNLYLMSTAMGLSCSAVTGYRDHAVKELLGLDEGEIPTALFAMGYPPGSSDE